jgi:hypothetical protein
LARITRAELGFVSSGLWLVAIANSEQSSCDDRSDSAPGFAAKDGEAQDTPRLVKVNATFAAQTLRQPAMARVSHLDPTDLVLSSAWRKLGGATHEGHGMSERFGSCHRALDLQKVNYMSPTLSTLLFIVYNARIKVALCSRWKRSDLRSQSVHQPPC